MKSKEGSRDMRDVTFRFCPLDGSGAAGQFKITRGRNVSRLFSKRSRDASGEQGRAFLRAGVSCVFSDFGPPPGRGVKGPDASLCVGRWRDCFSGLMKGGCRRLIRGYLGH